MTDTEAGTPLTATDLRDIVLDAQYRFGRMTKIPEVAWAVILDAARSRPATDAAGLDAERRTLVEDAVKAAASIGLHFPALCHAFGIDDTVGPAIDLARLSVADGPGPEERP